MLDLVSRGEPRRRAVHRAQVVRGPARVRDRAKERNRMSDTHSRPLTGHKAYGVPGGEWSQRNCPIIGQKRDDEVSWFST